MPSHQPDLFANESPRTRMRMSEADVARIRGELQATLRMAREAERFPWPNLNSTMLAEMRFHAMARWLPEEECRELREAFEVEMTRLYEAEDAAREAAGLIPPEDAQEDGG
jgi:hypothetical protein